MSTNKMFGGFSEAARTEPTLGAARPATVAVPPINAPLINAPSEAPASAPALSPELLRELAIVAGTLPAAPPGDDAARLTGTLDGGVLDRIHACRTAIEAVLGSTSKEFQVLKLLEETELGVCSELADNLRSRLGAHPLYQIKAKLDEAYTLALRYRKT